MNKIFKAMGVVIALFAVIAIVVCCVNAWVSPKLVKDAEQIAWCEAADDAVYEDIKHDLERFVENNYDVEVNKVVFEMDIDSYAYHEYSLEIWYRTVDGNWYYKQMRDISVPTKIDEKLVERVMFG